MFPLTLAAVLGYLLGSLPSAYLLVRWQAGRDLRVEGSGNVGTLNSYLVSRSRLVGATVLAVDLAKGALAVLITRALLNAEFAPDAVAGVCAAFGHNFPVWLGFRGGRGLAPAAGVFLVISWGVVPIWLGAWSLAYWPLRDINTASAVACVVALMTVLLLASLGVNVLVPRSAEPWEFACFTGAMMALILLRHVQPVREFIRNASRA